MIGDNDIFNTDDKELNAYRASEITKEIDSEIIKDLHTLNGRTFTDSDIYDRIDFSNAAEEFRKKIDADILELVLETATPGTVRYRFNHLLDELEKRFPLPENAQWSSAKTTEMFLLEAIDKYIDDMNGTTENSFLGRTPIRINGKVVCRVSHEFINDMRISSLDSRSEGANLLGQEIVEFLIETT